MSAHSVMLGLPVDASPWAVFEELGRRGFSITVTRGRDSHLRVTAVRREGLSGQIHALEADSISELALGLVESIATLPHPRSEPGSLEVSPSLMPGLQR